MMWMKIFTNNDVNTPNSEATHSEQQTAIGSLNVPETLEESGEIQTESRGTHRGSGRTLLKDLYELTPVERVKVSRNNLGQPVGSKARLLAGYLGIIARNANMLLSTTNHGIKCLIVTKIKLLIILRTVSELEQATGKRKKFTHTAGSKSFACVAEADELSSSQKFGRLQLFDITHRKKDGSPMTSKAGEIMEKLKDKKAEYEAIASSDSSINLKNIDNIIITEVLDPKSSEGSRAKQKIQRTPATASEYDVDASAVPEATILDVYFLIFLPIF
ncbi:hypothetical protein GOBAR_AA17698 [Gossypium barbadense]|uniref:Uncharacterized protein n=1 Tax=Gossypium barbadense TaxID=3634 RepID=A0A2P5XI31_GOSBA|nr:hypothetical protein GOBAR_AA17698 [Gossypium barbadense]